MDFVHYYEFPMLIRFFCNILGFHISLGMSYVIRDFIFYLVFPMLLGIFLNFVLDVLYY